MIHPIFGKRWFTNKSKEPTLTKHRCNTDDIEKCWCKGSCMCHWCWCGQDEECGNCFFFKEENGDCAEWKTKTLKTDVCSKWLRKPYIDERFPIGKKNA